MGFVVAVGGGPNGGNYSVQLERLIIDAMGLTSPKVLFIPFAATDVEEAIDSFKSVYEGHLHCDVTVVHEEQSVPDIEAMIQRADVVYLGGGSTLKLMHGLRSTGMDRLILNAFHRGTPLVGFSAGANSLCESGLSSEGSQGIITVPGLGLIEVFLCTHFNYSSRADAFKQLISQGSRTSGIGLTDNCALLVHNDRCRVLSVDGGQAYAIQVKGGELTTCVIRKAGR